MLQEDHGMAFEVWNAHKLMWSKKDTSVGLEVGNMNTHKRIYWLILRVDVPEEQG